MIRFQSWISSDDFSSDGFDDHPSTSTGPRKRKPDQDQDQDQDQDLFGEELPDLPESAFSEEDVNGPGQLWLSVHCPGSVTDLAVHPKKIEELKSWLQRFVLKKIKVN